jgi:hypothetical protein
LRERRKRASLTPVSAPPEPTDGDQPGPWRGATFALVAGAIVVSALLGFASLGCITENQDHYAAICDASALGDHAFTGVVLGGPVLVGVAGAIAVARNSGTWLWTGCGIAAAGYLMAIVLGLG